ncbi:MAG: NAD(P)H-dependent oxidoreductase subunit E, partial [Gemmatimonadaceae bacterium]
MDIRHIDIPPNADERDAIDALLGPPAGAWDGGERGSHRDAHTAVGGQAVRDQRHLLVPALQALQRRVGWISEGGMGYVCVRLSVPPAEACGVATFYALLATSPRPKRVLHVCDDIACRARGALSVERALHDTYGEALGAEPTTPSLTISDSDVSWMHSPCLGLCDQAPAALYTEAGITAREALVGSVTPERAIELLRHGTNTSDTPLVPQSGDQALVLLKRCGTVDPTSLDAYRASGGFAALGKARAMGAQWVIGEVTTSKLVGRGGAAFPTGRKWEAVRTQSATPHYVVCNADESEPGTFKDHVLLTQDPFAIVESMAIVAMAVDASKGFLYVRAEYPLASVRIENAIAQAKNADFLDGFDLEVRRGAGAYICGEETALFESIEGKRGEPRSKPPFPVQVGLFGMPTVVNNVETLANVIPIVMQGGAHFASVGSENSTGTRLFCLSGAVERPGVYEIPYGLTLRQLLEMAGSAKPLAVLLGGAAGTFVRGDELDIPLTLEGARAAGATLGSGVVMVFDAESDLRDMVLRIASFFRDESCGQCVPCRVGTVRQEEALHRIAAKRPLTSAAGELALLDEVGVAMRD